MCILYLIVYNVTRFTRSRCAENRNPQDHFRSVLVCYRTCPRQMTGTDFALIFRKKMKQQTVPLVRVGYDATLKSYRDKGRVVAIW